MKSVKKTKKAVTRKVVKDAEGFIAFKATKNSKCPKDLENCIIEVKLEDKSRICGSSPERFVWKSCGDGSIVGYKVLSKAPIEPVLTTPELRASWRDYLGTHSTNEEKEDEHSTNSAADKSVSGIQASIFLSFCVGFAFGCLVIWGIHGPF